MDRKPRVTQAIVNTACEELHAAGKNITVNAVITVTGGSFSTVGTMVKTWRAEQEANNAPVLEMPEVVTKVMQRATAEIWGASSNLASETIDLVRKESNKALDKKRAELAEHADEITRLEGELESSRKSREAAKDRLGETLQQLSELTAQRSALKTQLTDRDHTIEQLRADYDKLQNELITIAKRGATKTELDGQVK